MTDTRGVELTADEIRRLSANADRQARSLARYLRFGGFALIAFAVVGLVLPIVVDGTIGAASWAAMGLIAAIGVASVVAGTRVRRPGRRPLVAGAGPATRKAVRDALRAGHADSPRIDALVRDQLDLKPQLWRRLAAFYGLLLVLQVLLAATAGNWVRHVNAAIAAVSLVNLVVALVMDRRARRYRKCATTGQDSAG